MAFGTSSLGLIVVGILGGLVSSCKPTAKSLELGTSGLEEIPQSPMDLASANKAAFERARPFFSEIGGKYGMSAQELDALIQRDADLRIDERRDLFYACASKEETDRMRQMDPLTTQEEEIAPAAAGEPDPGDLDQFLSLHSRPGAPRTILLDFTGHSTSDTAWNAGAGRPATIVTPPYDIDGNPNVFSPTERANIVAIWRAVAEDFAAFDVDVTTAELDPSTELPLNLADRGVRAAIGGSSFDWYGSGSGVGGVAYINIFGKPFYGPVFVFPAQLGGGTPKFVWEAISHEVGHALGLHHDGIATSPYYLGHENWAPIMGTGYYRTISQWSKGEYPGAIQTEDDLAIMTDGNREMVHSKQYLRYRQDDFGSSASNSTDLDTSPQFTWQESPTDTTRRQIFIPGVIERTGDADYFRFKGVTGRTFVTLDLVPPTADLKPRANVDLKLEVFAQGSSSPIVSIDAAENLLMGTREICLPAEADYHVAVTGVGDQAPGRIGYSNYGSLGEYRLKIDTPSISAPSPCPVVPPPVHNPNGFTIKEVQSGVSKSGNRYRVGITYQVMDASGRPIVSKVLSIGYRWSSPVFSALAVTKKNIRLNREGKFTIYSPRTRATSGSATLTITRAGPSSKKWVGIWNDQASTVTWTVPWP